MNSICFVGKSGTGKTTLIVKVIENLSNKGYKIGTIKHHNHTTHFDQEDKDTYKHYMAGAQKVIISSPAGYGVFVKVEEELTLEQIMQLHKDMDLVIVEGFKREGVNKIEIVRKERSYDRICSDEEVIAVVSNIEIDTQKPCFGIEDIGNICNFIEKNFLLS